MIGANDSHYKLATGRKDNTINYDVCWHMVTNSNYDGHQSMISNISWVFKCYPVRLVIAHGSCEISVNACKFIQTAMNIKEIRTNDSKKIQSLN